MSAAIQSRRHKPAEGLAEDLAFPPPTIFHEAWWLHAASGGAYHEAVAKSGDRVVGRFPFQLTRTRDGRLLNTMPELTFFLGPVIEESDCAQCNRVVKRNRILNELIDQMPIGSLFYQKMHAGVAEMIGFQEHGFDVTVQFTHEIRPADQMILWRNLRDKTRNVIRRAEEALSVGDLDDPAEFLAFYEANLGGRGRRNLYRRSTILRLTSECRARGRGRILAARDAQGRLVAAIFTVWDARRAYYLMTTRTADAANGAVSLLLWRAITESAAAGLIFDFAGLAAGGDLLFFSGFGGTISPRFIASRQTMRQRVTSYAMERLRGQHDQGFA